MHYAFSTIPTQLSQSFLTFPQRISHFPSGIIYTFPTSTSRASRLLHTFLILLEPFSPDTIDTRARDFTRFQCIQRPPSVRRFSFVSNS